MNYSKSIKSNTYKKNIIIAINEHKHDPNFIVLLTNSMEYLTLLHKYEILKLCVGSRIALKFFDILISHEVISYSFSINESLLLFVMLQSHIDKYHICDIIIDKCIETNCEISTLLNDSLIQTILKCGDLDDLSYLLKKTTPYNVIKHFFVTHLNLTSSIISKLVFALKTINLEMSNILDIPQYENIILDTIKNNNISLIKELIGCGLNVKHHNDKLLIHAISFGSYEIVDILLTNGCSVDSVEAILFDTSIKNELFYHQKMLLVLMKHGKKLKLKINK